LKFTESFAPSKSVSFREAEKNSASAINMVEEGEETYFRQNLSVPFLALAG
jgi:hypothetical protein